MDPKGSTTSALIHAGLRPRVNAVFVSVCSARCPHAQAWAPATYWFPQISHSHRCCTWKWMIVALEAVQMCNRSVQFILTTCHQCAQWELRSITGRSDGSLIFLCCFSIHRNKAKLKPLNIFEVFHFFLAIRCYNAAAMDLYIGAGGGSAYPLIMRCRSAPMYSGDEWNLWCSQPRA